MNKLQKAARQGALSILEASEGKRSWTDHERLQFTKAFNALQRLAGKKVVMTKDGLRTDPEPARRGE